MCGLVLPGISSDRTSSRTITRKSWIDMDASVGVDCIGDKLIPEFRGTVGGLLGKLWGTFGEILGGLTGLILGF